MRTAIAVAGPPATAAVLGNAFIGKDSMRWFRELRAPRLQLPMAAFGVVGAAYYAQLGVVLHRARRNDDRHARRCALVVLAGNELWNVAFFGRRSPRNGFLGVLLSRRGTGPSTGSVPSGRKLPRDTMTDQGVDVRPAADRNTRVRDLAHVEVCIGR